jgi:hypothetical protein
MSEANPNIHPTTKTLGFAKLNPTYTQPAILHSPYTRQLGWGFAENP